MAALSPVVHAGAFIQLMGFCFLHLAMWGLNCFLVRSFQIPIVWLVGLATGGCMLGEVSMGLIALAAKAAFGSQVAICLVEGGLVMAFMVVALLLSDSRNLKDGWSLSKPSDSKPAFANFDSLLDHVCDQYDLSTRERDVFLLFARGRNRKFIAERLSVSEETVKSHISAIYRKTGSHNQQEIISIVEEYAREN